MSRTMRFFAYTGPLSPLFVIVGLAIALFTAAADHKSPMPSAKFYTLGGIAWSLMVFGIIALLVAGQGAAKGHRATPPAYFVICTKLLLTGGMLLAGLWGRISFLTAVGFGLLAMVTIFEVVLPRHRPSRP